MQVAFLPGARWCRCMTLRGRENLKRLSPEEARENGKKGGRASVKARRKKKAIKDCLLILRDMPVADMKVKSMLEKMGIKDKDITYGMAIAASATIQAIKGNTSMARLILETMDEIGAQKLEITGKDGKPLDATPKVQIYLPDNHRG